MFNFKKGLKKEKGFTLVEILVYSAVLAVMLLAISNFFLWVKRANNKTRSQRQVLNDSAIAMEILSNEIKSAKEIYDPTTVEDSPGQLSLKTAKNVPAGEDETYVDFYVCENRLCIKRESESQEALTSDKTEITKFSRRAITFVLEFFNIP